MTRLQPKKEESKCSCAYCKLGEIKKEIEGNLVKVQKQLKDTALMLYPHEKYFDGIDKF